MLESHTQYVTEQWLLPVRKVRNRKDSLCSVLFGNTLLVLAVKDPLELLYNA
jgi:hypothetical protein